MASTDTRVSNLKAFEGTVAASAAFVFPWPVTQMIVTNDGGNDLMLSFGGGTMTLRPNETITLSDTRIRRFTLMGNSIPYRVWGMG